MYFQARAPLSFVHVQLPARVPNADMVPFGLNPLAADTGALPVSGGSPPVSKGAPPVSGGSPPVSAHRKEAADSLLLSLAPKLGVGSVLVFSRLFNHADYLSGACLIYIYRLI